MRKHTVPLLFFVAVIALCALGCDEPSKEKPSGVVIVKCNPAENTCLSRTEVWHCVGDERVREYCPREEYCFAGECNPVVCQAGRIDSCLEDGRYHGCNVMGTGEGDFDCPDNKTCSDGECIQRLCLEGTGNCLDDETIMLCNKAGTAFTERKKCADIAPKTICEEDRCIPICEQQHKVASYIGCEYWAVDLDNAIDGQGTLDAAAQPFAVVLSNTHEKYTASVEVYERQGDPGDRKTMRVLSFDVPPGELVTIFLPTDCYRCQEIDAQTKKCVSWYPPCGAAYFVNGTTIQDAAFYIKSDLPITAAQFNPLENVDVFSNDASLLFPVTALGQRYMVMSRRQHYDIFSGFVTVVATQPGQTEVAVQTSCNTRAGVDKNGKTIPAMRRGDTQIFYLDQYDVLNLATAAIGDDLTGSTVTSNKAVAVFAGNEATSIPETDPVTCCADHIEHQLYPLGAWGRRYNAVKLKPRGQERDMWRILARTDNTVVTTTPNIFSEESLTLNAGQWYDYLGTASFTIEATAPILVGQFMTGQFDPLNPETGAQDPRWAGIGDPAFIIGVPIEQYRTDYRFLVPAKYKEDYITIVAPKDASAQLDGEAVADNLFHTFGDGTYKYAYIMVEDGVHTITATKPIGLFSYGIDRAVSYGYPAGLDLRELYSE